MKDEPSPPAHVGETLSVKTFAELNFSHLLQMMQNKQGVIVAETSL